MKKFYGSQKGKKANELFLELEMFDDKPKQEPEENLKEKIKFESDKNKEDTLKELS